MNIERLVVTQLARELCNSIIQKANDWSNERIRAFLDSRYSPDFR